MKPTATAAAFRHQPDVVFNVYAYTTSLEGWKLTSNVSFEIKPNKRAVALTLVLQLAAARTNYASSFFAAGKRRLAWRVCAALALVFC